MTTLTSPAARTIARAMQEYGLIVTDKSGAIATQAEDPRPEMARTGDVNPYPALLDPDDVLPDGYEQYLARSEIPVERLQALPLDYGRPACGASRQALSDLGCVVELPPGRRGIWPPTGVFPVLALMW